MTDKLNQKIKSSFDKEQDRVLVSGMYGYNETSKKFNYCNVDDNGDLKVNIHATGGGGDLKARTDPNDSSTSVFLKSNANNHLKTQLVGFDGVEFRDIKCNANGELEMTAEISSAGLATEAKQDAMITHLSDIDNQTNSLLTYQVLINQTQSNGNQVVKCMGNNGGNNVQLKVDANGVLETSGGGGSTQVIAQAEDDTGSARNLRCNNSGHQKSQLIANTVGDGSGTNKVVHCNDAGQLKTQLIGEDNTATRRAIRTNTVGHIQTATLANTAGDGSGTIKNVVCNTAGNLVVKAEITNETNTEIDVNTHKDEVSVSQVNQAITNGNTFTSTSVDMRGYGTVSFFGTSTNTNDSIVFEVSEDNTTFYLSGTVILQDFTSGNFQHNYTGAARYCRIKQGTTDLNNNMTITCISSKK